MMSDNHDDAPPDLTLEAGHFPIDVRFPSDVRYIEPLVAVVSRNCARLAFPPRVVNLQVPVALSEALSNAILRGNGEHPDKQVRVRACVDASGIVVEVEDEGAGFDLDASVNDPAEPGNLEREDGRGLFLMRALMDRVEQFRDDGDGGNVVRLTLRRP